MRRPSPARTRTTTWSSYNASLRKRGALLIWVDKDMAWRAPSHGRPGRPPVFSDEEDQKTVRETVFPTNAIQFCLSIKGEGRPGNDPGDRASPERAEPGASSSLPLSLGIAIDRAMGSSDDGDGATWLTPDRQTAEIHIHIRILRRLSRTGGARLLGHEPRRRPRHRRDCPRGRNLKGKGERGSRASGRGNATTPVHIDLPDGIR